MATKDVWLENLSDELGFWWKWLTDDTFEPHRKDRMDSCQELQQHLRELLPPDQTVYAVLDVGSGPVSGVGALIPGKIVNLYLVDALAIEYNKMLNRLGVKTAIRPIQLEGEKLTSVFPEDYFDLVVCMNALDHTYDPMQVIREIMTVCKPGCWAFLGHHNNVGVIENYAGLHQWNLDHQDGRFIVWNRELSRDVLDSVLEIGAFRSEQVQMPEGTPPLTHVWLQKRSSRAIEAAK